MGILDKFHKKKQTKPPEVSPGGSTIYRYKTPEDRGWQPPRSVRCYGEEVTEHFQALFPNRKAFVFHELISDLVHIDINILQPTEKDDYYVLYTTGMSDLPMTLPGEIADREDLKYCELYLFLPGGWNLGKTGDLNSDLPASSYWPIGLLKFLARFPHDYKTWLGWGHTVPNGPQYAPLAEDVDFGGAALAQPSCVPPLKSKDGAEVKFYMVIPAYREEIEYKLKYGMEELGKRFAEGGLSLVLDPHRPNLCAGFTEVLD